MANPLGNVTTGVVGAGVGIAAANVAEAILEVERQQAWRDNAYRVLDLGALAQLVAQGLATLDDAAEQASRNGFNRRKLAARVQLELKAPGVAEVLELWRRNASRPPSEQITDAQVDHALAKAQIEPQYWPALKELFGERLDPVVIARAIQRGVMKAPFPLPYNVDVPVGNIKPFPVSPLDAKAEAIAGGYDVERLRVETALVGLPMALDRAARATFRGILTDSDFLRAVLEGNARGEWAEAELEVAREILSAGQYTESRLRGYTATDDEMYANTAKHGMSREDTRLLFLNQGRPLSIHQLTTGLARGGVYNGPTDAIPKAYFDAVRESNIKPPYYNLDYANRYTFPAPFVLRALTEGGDLEGYEGRDNRAASEQILLYLGWEPKLAKTVSTKWSTTKAAGVDKHVTLAETQFIAAIKTAFVGGAITDAQGVEQIALTSLPAAAQTGVLGYWRKQRALERIPPPPATTAIG